MPRLPMGCEGRQAGFTASPLITQLLGAEVRMARSAMALQ